MTSADVYMTNGHGSWHNGVDEMVCAASDRTVIDDETVYAAPDGALDDDAVDEDELMYVIPDGAMVDELV